MNRTLKYALPLGILCLAGLVFQSLRESEDKPPSRPSRAEPAQAGVSPPRTEPPKPETQTAPTLAENGSVGELVRAILAEPDEEKQQRLGIHLAEAATPEDAAQLLDLVQQTDNPELLKGAQMGLALNADILVGQQLVAAYEQAPTDEAARNLAQAVEWINRPDALPELEKILQADHIPTADRLTLAAVRAIAKIGTPHAANVIARRLERQVPAEIRLLTEALQSMNLPHTQQERRNIAEGLREWKSDVVRKAAAVGK